MKVKDLPLDDITPYWRNPRDNSGAVEAVKASIREFGVQQPLVVDKDNVIIAGHTRYRAMVELGMQTAPVVVADLPPRKAKAYRIADNKTAEKAEWDVSKLVAELREVADEVDMNDFFDPAELERLLAGAGGMRFDLPDQADIDKAADAAAGQYDDVHEAKQAGQVEVICPHCGETSFVEIGHLTREAAAKVS